MINLETNTLGTKAAKVFKGLKRNFAYLTLAMADVSKSAIANQKSIGIDGAAQAKTVSAWHEDKHTVSDMKAGLHNKATAELASRWWGSFFRSTRYAHIDGEYRELTDAEWQERIERLAEPANTKYGEVVFMHDVQRYTNDNAALEYHDDGRVSLNQVKLDASRTATIHFDAVPGFYFPMDSITRLFARKDIETNAVTIELHSDLTEEEPNYHMALDKAYRPLLKGLRRVALVQREATGMSLYSYALRGTAKVTKHKGGLVLTFAATDELPTVEESLALQPMAQ